MRYIRFVVSVLLMFGVSGLPVWGISFAEVDTQVERKVGQAKGNAKAPRPAAKRNSAKLTDRQKIVKALDGVRLKMDDPALDKHIMTLSQFEQKNETITIEIEQRFKTQTALQKQINDILTPRMSAAVKQKIYSQKTERPNYGLETKGVPYIYLTDSSGHGTQTILQEVVRVMKQVRQANPQANILLATEFALMKDFATPIQFANTTQPQLNISGMYKPLVDTANQAHIDLLALDDLTLRKWPDGMTCSKLGDQLLYIPYSFVPGNAQAVSEICFSLGTSPLGVRLRNEQWARYLKAVEPYYNIVIVYSGDGHIRDPYMTNWNVPALLTAKHIIFNFYTLEKAERGNEAPTVKVQNQKKAFYKKTNLRARREWIQTLPANIQTRLQQVKQKWKQAKIKEEPPTMATFEIYLPDVTR